MSNPKTLEIEDLIRKRDWLAIEIDKKRRLHGQLTKQIKTLQEEADRLLRVERGLYSREIGEIIDKEKELEALKVLIADSGKPVVYWAKYDGKEQAESSSLPERWGKALDTCFIVERVTKKRIYIRMKGIGNKVHQYEYDGTNVGTYKRDKIDIAKTFPEGIKPS